MRIRYAKKADEAISRTIRAAASGRSAPVCRRAKTDPELSLSYTFGPGMTFRDAVAFGEFDPGDEDVVGGAIGAGNDFTQVTLGTNIQF